MGTIFFAHHRIVLAVKRLDFISDRVSYIVFRGRRCDIIVLSTHETSKEKHVDSKDSFMKNYNRFSVIFLSTK